MCFCADHYLAKLAGLLPEDPLTAALADQAYFFCEDVWQTMWVLSRRPNLSTPAFLRSEHSCISVISAPLPAALRTTAWMLCPRSYRILLLLSGMIGLPTVCTVTLKSFVVASNTTTCHIQTACVQVQGVHCSMHARNRYTVIITRQLFCRTSGHIPARQRCQ
jgi:hypothetical protein